MRGRADDAQSSILAAAPLVGRERELELLRESFRQAVQGNGRLVLVSGEAGIGKTSLVQAFTEEASSHDAMILHGYCYDLTTTPPYGLWLELTDRYPAREDLPELPDALKRGTGVGDLPTQSALFDVARDFLDSLSRAHPLVVVLEDMHWADPASLDLLRYLVHHLEGMRLLVIATYRDDELDRRHPLFTLIPLLVREAHALRITPAGLTREDLHALVSKYWSLSTDDEGRLVELLLTHAEGHPLFTVEILRTLEQDRYLRRGEDGWKLEDVSQAPVPALVQQLIEGRLAHFEDRQRRFLEVAAVIGHQAPLDVWRQAADMSEDDLLQVLDHAIAARILEQPTGSQDVRFAHSLTRAALYESMLLPHRRASHRRVAEQLERRRGPDPDSIAYHFQQAGDDRAVAWLMRAGERAFETYAWSTAADRFETALNLAPYDDDRMRERGWLTYRVGHLLRYVEPARAIDLLESALKQAREIDEQALIAHSALDLGLVYCISGEIRPGLEQLRAAAAIWESIPASGGEIPTEGLPSSNRSPGLCLVWLGAVGPHREAIAFGERYIAEGRVDPFGIPWGMGFTLAALGRPEEALREFARAREALVSQDDVVNAGMVAFAQLIDVLIPYFPDRRGERRNLTEFIHQNWMRGIGGLHDGFNPRLSLVEGMILEGDWAEARAILVTIPDTFSQMKQYADSRLGWLDHNQGNADQAWRRVESMLPDGPAAEPGDCIFRYAVESIRLAVDLALDAGDHAAASTWLETHRRWLEWSGPLYGRSEETLLRARLRLLEGDATGSLECAREALQLAREPRQPLALIAAHRFLGALYARDGQDDDARSHLAESLKLAESCAVPFERALTMLSQAEMLQSRGAAGEARSLLAEARRIASELGAVPIIERIDALAGGARRSAADNRFGLSRREIEVLQLLVQGKPDREIGEDLFISSRTVMNHVASILRKLDVDSRTAAAAEAIRNELV